jgi:hypothetical protein
MTKQTEIKVNINGNTYTATTVDAALREIEHRCDQKPEHLILVSTSHNDGSPAYDLWAYASELDADGDLEGYSVLGVICDVPADTPCDDWV